MNNDSILRKENSFKTSANVLDKHSINLKKKTVHLLILIVMHDHVQEVDEEKKEHNFCS